MMLALWGSEAAPRVLDSLGWKDVSVVADRHQVGEDSQGICRIYIALEHFEETPVLSLLRTSQPRVQTRTAQLDPSSGQQRVSILLFSCSHPRGVLALKDDGPLP